MKADEIGSTRAWTRGSDASYQLHPDCYADLKSAWMSGKAFYEGRDVYGDEVVIKLGEVTGIAHWTPGAIAEAAEERKAENLAGGER